MVDKRLSEAIKAGMHRDRYAFDREINIRRNRGETLRQVAAHMGIAPETVRRHELKSKRIAAGRASGKPVPGGKGYWGWCDDA